MRKSVRLALPCVAAPVRSGFIFIRRQRLPGPLLARFPRRGRRDGNARRTVRHVAEPLRLGGPGTCHPGPFLHRPHPGHARFALGGNILNLGVTLPTRAGVFTGIGRFRGRRASLRRVPGLDWGTAGRAAASLSRRIFFLTSTSASGSAVSSEATGASGSTSASSSSSAMSVFSRTFRWGGAIRNIGRAYLGPIGPGSLGLPAGIHPGPRGGL